MKPILSMQYIDSLRELRDELRTTNPAPQLDQGAAIEVDTLKASPRRAKSLLERLRRLYAKA